METLLNSVGAFFTQAVDWLGTVLDTVVGNPALLILVIAMPVCGLKICETTLNRVKTGKTSYETIPCQA